MENESRSDEMKTFEECYEKITNLPEWPPKDDYDLHYSHKMVWSAALSVASEAQAQATPAEDRYGREPEKVKPLAQYLDEYIEHEIENGNIRPAVSDLFAYNSWRELLQQALDAYESTENVKIIIERK